MTRRGDLHLIRHAETTYNRPPKRFQGRMEAPLSEAGHQAAEQLVDEFRWVEHVISSPAIRCRQTLTALGLNDRPVRFDERLWEIDVGRWSGEEEDYIAKIEPSTYTTWREAPQSIRPGGDGESLEELCQRCFAAINAAFAESEGDRTLVITHGGPIRTVLLALQGLPSSHFHKLIVPNLYLAHVPADAWAHVQARSFSA